MADKFEKKEGNEDKQRCLEDMMETLTGAAVLVERLRDAKNGKHHRRKLNQGKADEDFVSYREALFFVCRFLCFVFAFFNSFSFL